MSTTETINFTRGVPANESFPTEEIAAATQRALQKHAVAMLQYGPAAGLAIDARTGRCRWLGERMDYSLAIEGMQWREANAAARCAAPPAAT